jgi:hypothetical protein
MEYNIKFTAEELVLVGDALATLPSRNVVNIIAKLQAQINEQEQPEIKPTVVNQEF